MARPTFADLFCGIGGFRLGLEAAGFRCVYANDINRQSTMTYETNRDRDAAKDPDYVKYKIETKDIRQVDMNKIPDHHLLAAGFP